MGLFSAATAAGFFCYSTFTRIALRCECFHYWRNTTNCYLFLVLYIILLQFSSMFLCKISFFASSDARLPFSILKENKTLCLESANGRCSVKKVSFFVAFSWCGHWLTCLARKGYSHKRLHFSQIILPEMRTEGIRSLRNLAVQQ